MQKVLIICLLFACSAAQEPYCIRNETIRKMVGVHKTRTVPTKKSWKIWQKQSKHIEDYVEYEEHIEHKPISECCPGYHMTELKLCEPTCPNGCPAYASCEAPNTCRCKPGFIQTISHHDGRPYCEPMCPNECPSGTFCREPNKCECKAGYHVMDDGSGRCVPQCTSGDGCRHGRCVDVDECICDNGYIWHEATARCMANDDADMYTTSRSMEQKQEQETDEVEIDSDEDDSYSTKISFIHDTPTSETTESSLSTVRMLTECPEGYILYKGECRAEDFSYDAATTTAAPTNCNQTPCGHNQICLPNGNCSCASGFESQSKGAQQATEGNNERTNTLVCLLAATMSDAASNVLGKPENKTGMHITFICLIGICAAVLLAVVTVKLMRRRQSGTLDVDATEKQHIQFTNEACDSNLWVP